MPFPPHTPIRLAVSDLAASRGERRLFAGLGFTLAAGDILAVTGPNGVGKTTLLRVLAGFVRPDAGVVSLDGLGAESEPPQAMHFVGHRDGLKGALTVRENLALAPALMGAPGLEPAQAAARLRLEPLLDLPVGVLSAGQRRRAALARLLTARRPVWLLDEPTAALDAVSQGNVAGLLSEHAAAGGIVIATTHYPLDLGAHELALRQDGSVSLKQSAA